jgi:hypothetical protein
MAVVGYIALTATDFPSAGLPFCPKATLAVSQLNYILGKAGKSIVVLNFGPLAGSRKKGLACSVRQLAKSLRQCRVA